MKYNFRSVPFKGKLKNLNFEVNDHQIIARKMMQMMVKLNKKCHIGIEKEKDVGAHSF